MVLNFLLLSIGCYHRQYQLRSTLLSMLLVAEKVLSTVPVKSSQVVGLRDRVAIIRALLHAVVKSGQVSGLQ